MKKNQVWQFVTIIFLVFIASSSHSQSQRNFPMESRFGNLTTFVFPEVTIDGKTMVMGPGGQIRDANNLIVFPNQLNQTGDIRYQQDSMGLIYRIWFLTPEEAALAREESAYKSR